MEVLDFWEDEITVEYGDIDEPTGRITQDDSCLSNSNQDSIQEYMRTDENCNLASLEDEAIQPATPVDGTRTLSIEFSTYSVRGFVLKDCEVRVERLSEKFISEAVSRSNGGSIISASEKADKRTCRNRGEKGGLHTPEAQKSSIAAKQYKCRGCDQVFEHFFDLLKHQKITRAPNNLTGEHKCDICEERYDSMCGLRFHYSKKHAGVKWKNCKPRCKTCLESFESWPLLFEHKKTCNRPTGTQKEEKCTVCGRSSKNLREHMKIHGDKKHFCDICGKRFLKTHELKLHLTTHSKEKPYTCELCGKGVACMKTHLKTCLEHRAESEKNFICAHCGKDFFLEASLKRHEFWEHLSLNRFECDVCHKKFRSKCFLQMHRRRIHFPEERIRCSICSASFARKYDLKCHVESDHLGNLFKCSVCNLEFKTRVSLNRHELLHKFGKRYECQVCGKKFGSTNHLKRHEATHDRQSKTVVSKVTRTA